MCDNKSSLFNSLLVTAIFMSLVDRLPIADIGCTNTSLSTTCSCRCLGDEPVHVRHKASMCFDTEHVQKTSVWNLIVQRAMIAHKLAKFPTQFSSFMATENVLLHLHTFAY